MITFPWWKNGRLFGFKKQELSIYGDFLWNHGGRRECWGFSPFFGFWLFGNILARDLILPKTPKYWFFKKIKKLLSLNNYLDFGLISGLKFWIVSSIICSILWMNFRGVQIRLSWRNYNSIINIIDQLIVDR